MKKLIILLAVLVSVVVAFESSVAVPTLQLYLPGATYHALTDTWIIDSPNFELWVVASHLNTSSNGTIYDIEIAACLANGTDPSSGSLTITPIAGPGVTYGNGDFVWGTPPPSDPMPGHGIYPGNYITLQVADSTPPNPVDWILIQDYIPGSGGGDFRGFIYKFNITTTYDRIHFDAYGFYDDQFGKRSYAPFSHDAEYTSLDGDGDGIVDPLDNCPEVYNPNQEDTDGDSVGDSCDICPGFDDAIDSDADGVPDGCDNCPNDPNKTEPGDCGCGVADTDYDDDGVVDCLAFPALQLYIDGGTYDDLSDTWIVDYSDFTLWVIAANLNSNTLYDIGIAAVLANGTDPSSGSLTITPTSPTTGPASTYGDGDFVFGTPPPSDPMPSHLIYPADHIMHHVADNSPLDPYDWFPVKDYIAGGDGGIDVNGYMWGFNVQTTYSKVHLDVFGFYDDYPGQRIHAPFDHDAEYTSLDGDGDGIVDPLDNCPGAYNPNQEDTDGDGIGDVCDICPGFDDAIDSDADGVPDGCDNCPNDYNPNQDNSDNDSQGDACDNCPSVDNEPPVFLSGCDQTVVTQPGIEKDLQLTAADAACPSDPLWYLVLDNPSVAGAYSIDSASGLMTYTAVSSDQGLQTFTVGVTDGMDTSYCDVSFNVITGGSNSAPSLSWVGNPGYESDAVEPDTGISSQDYVFRVKYSDPDGDPPAEGYPLVMIDYDGDMPGAGSNEVTYQMHLEQPGDFVAGVVYSCVIPYLPVSGAIQYTFAARDDQDADATEDIVLVAGYKAGPHVIDDAVDLFIYASMIEFSDLNPEASEQFQSAVSLFNNSFQTFSDVIVQYYMQVNYVDVLVETVEIASLAPGLYTLPNRSWQIDLPGFYPITVVIDPGNTVEEWNEDNNSAVRPVTIGEFTVPGAMNIANLSIASTVCPGSYLGASGVGWYIIPPNDEHVARVAGAEVTATLIATQDSWTGHTNSAGGFNIGFTAPETLGTYDVEILITDFTLYYYDTLSFNVVDCDQPEPTCPDLSASISLTNLPLTLVSNPSTDYSVRVYNNGYSSVSSVAVRILSDNAVIASPVTGPLDPGTYVDLAGGQIPYTAAGQHTLRVIVDPDNLYAECNEQNNNTTRSHYVWPHCADLAAEAMTTNRSNPYLNESFGISVRVGNNGGLGTGSFWVMFFADGELVDSTLVASAAGFGAEFWTGFNYSFAVAGQHTLRAELDSRGEIAECSESNNSIELNVVVRDLYVDLWTSYSDVGLTEPASESAIGQSVEFKSRIYNSGNDDAINVFVEYFIDTVLLSNSTIALIPAGSSIVDTADSSWTVVEGRCNLIVKIDPNDDIAESNEGNNVASCPLLHEFAPYYTSRCAPQRPGPIFINSCEGGIAQAFLGTEVTLTASANNTGAFVVDGPVTARITDLAEGHIGDLLLSGLNDHGGNYVSDQLTHTFTTRGWHRLSMEIDPSGEFSDCNTNNNTYVDSIFIDILRPDLWLYSEHIDASSINPDVDEPVTFDATIYNTGEIQADNVSVAFFVDTTRLGDIVTIPIIPIENNDNYRTIYATKQWIATDLPDPQHVIRVVADFSGTIEELNETNNEATRDILVGAVADITFVSGSVELANLEGELCETIGVSFIVKNLGGLDATCSIRLNSATADGLPAPTVSGVFVPGHSGETQATIEWTLPSNTPNIELEIYEVVEGDFNSLNNDIEVPFDKTGLRPCLGVDPTSFSFSSYLGSDDPVTSSLSVFNMGDGLLEWYVDEQIDWLSITPFEGPSNQTNILITAEPTGLDLGSYAGQMIATSTNADNGPDTIDVSFTIETAPPVYGTTVIIHGLVPFGEFGDNLDNEATWVMPMASEIINRLGSGRLFRIENGFRQGSITPLNQVVPGEQVVAFSWIPESDEPTRGFAEGAADALFSQLVKGANLGLWRLNRLHFIAHSRGAVVAAEAIQRLGLYANDLEALSTIGTVDTNIHFTTLDAHPWDNETGNCIEEPLSAEDESVNNGYSLVEDMHPDKSRSIVPWANISYFDNYHQVTCGSGSPFEIILNGLAGYQIYGLNPRASFWLDDTMLGTGSSSENDHSLVHSWYYGTINITCGPICSDGDGITFRPSDWYTDTWPMGPRYAVGFNRSRNFDKSGFGDFIPDNSIPLAEDFGLYPGSIFNGDFSMNNGKIIGVGAGNDPGWSCQGGTGDMNIVGVFEKRLKLKKSNPLAVHNWTYIPSNATHINLSYEVNNKDFRNTIDEFKVLIDDDVIGTPIPLDKYYDRDWYPIPISGTVYPGTVRKITLLLDNADQERIASKVLVDDVHFILDNQERAEFINKGYCTVLPTQNPGSLSKEVLNGLPPVNIRVTDPDGFSVDKDTSSIEGATYDYTIDNESDTGVFVTIPVMKVGTYVIDVIPGATADSNDIYSIYGFSDGKLVALAEEVRIADIPEDGYQMCGAYGVEPGGDACCCVGGMGNVDCEGIIDIGDVTAMIQNLFITLNDPCCEAEADMDQSGLVDIGDLTMLISSLFITLNPLPECP